MVSEIAPVCGCPPAVAAASADGLRPVASQAVETTDMSVVLTKPIAMEEGLKFAIREGGRTVGAGRVTKINE